MTETTKNVLIDQNLAEVYIEGDNLVFAHKEGPTHGSEFRTDADHEGDVLALADNEPSETREVNGFSVDVLGSVGGLTLVYESDANQYGVVDDTDFDSIVVPVWLNADNVE